MAKAKKSTKSKPKSSKKCGCGCGKSVNEGSTFLPGHDMKLKSKLLQRMRCGDKSAMRTWDSYGWKKPKL